MLLALALIACSSAPNEGKPPADSAAPGDEQVGEDGVLDRTVDLAPPENGYQAVTEPTVVPPYTEVDICNVVRVDPKGDEKVAWFSDLESLSAEGSHHMNVTIGEFSFLDAFVAPGASENAIGVPLGAYPCSELNVMSLGVPVFPSQRENQRITLPDGVGAPLPLPLIVVASHHYVNPTDTPIRINTALNIETIDRSEIDHVGSIVFDAIGGLELKPGTRQSVSRTCVMDEDTNVALVSTHTHEWATCATLNEFDGETETVEDDPFFVTQEWDRPPILHFQSGEFQVEAGDGIHWACHYENPSDRTIIDDGSAQGEMCVMAAVTWPAPYSVTEVDDIIQSGDLQGLLALLDEVLGSCDSTRDDVLGPWLSEATEISGDSLCDALPETESNTLD